MSQSKKNKNKFISHKFIDVRTPQRFTELNKIPIMKQFPIVQKRFEDAHKKITEILSKHQCYTLYVLLYKILGIFQQFGNEPRKRFVLKDPSNKSLIKKKDFYEVINSFGCQLTVEEFNLIGESLTGRINDLYSYDEFLDKVYNILKIENGQLVQIYRECNYLFNDYLYNFRHYILDNKINYQIAYIKVFNNMTLMPYDLFKKFLAEINYNLPHEEENKYLFSNIGELNYLWNSVNLNIINNCSKKNLDELMNINEISEENFIKYGKIVKEKKIKTANWKKNIKKFNNETKELYKKKYNHLENMFKTIHQNCIRYNIDNFVDYFENANVDITNEGDIQIEDFKTLMRNIGISENLTFQSVLNSFKDPNPSKKNYFKLVEFLNIYLMFKNDEDQIIKNNNKNNNVQKNKMNMNQTNKKVVAKDEKNINYVYKNKHRKFVQDDIDHISDLCKFLAGIIIDEKKYSVTNYFKSLDLKKQGFITMKQLKSVFKVDLEIEIDEDDSMNDFFDFVMLDEKINGNYVVKIDRLIQVIKGYSKRDGPNK
jgi:Ca2+-binding EF-hand superfamily protein